MPTFDDILDGLEHRFCVRHLYANFKNRFGGGTGIRDLMMGAAKATYPKLFNDKMQEIKGLNELAYNWLAELPARAWSKHAQSWYPKCDVLINNLSESF